MKTKIITKRYAEAYVESNLKLQGLEKISGEFKALKRCLYDSPDIMSFFSNPEITYSEKVAFIDKVFGIDFSVEFCDFLKYLITKKRIDMLPEIAEYIRVNFSHGEALEAVLKTTLPLEVKDVEDIKKKLEKKFERKINLYIDLDPSLLGGIKVVIKNTIIIDGSVRKRLEDLRSKLEMVRVI